MTDAPTTRETADHAELAVDDDCETCSGTGEVEAQTGWGGDYIPCPACISRQHESEIAALRSAKWDVQHVDTMNDMVLMGMARDEAIDRAAQAEGLLREILPPALCGESWDLPDHDVSHQPMSFGWIKRARAFLANQGADQ